MGNIATTPKSFAEEIALEARLIEHQLNAPRLTPSSIDAVIEGVQFHVFVGTTLTVCCLTLRNGYCVTGESAAVSLANFDPDIGRDIAFKNARDKIWALEGYLLRNQLHQSQEQQGKTP